MDTKCPRCGAIASWQITGRDSYRTSTESDATLKCLVLEELFMQRGSVDNFDCPYLAKAVADAERKYRRENPRVVFTTEIRKR